MRAAHGRFICTFDPDGGAPSLDRHVRACFVALDVFWLSTEIPGLIARQRQARFAVQVEKVIFHVRQVPEDLSPLSILEFHILAQYALQSLIRGDLVVAVHRRGATAVCKAFFCKTKGSYRLQFFSFQRQDALLVLQDYDSLSSCLTYQLLMLRFN